MNYEKHKSKNILTPEGREIIWRTVWSIIIIIFMITTIILTMK